MAFHRIACCVDFSENASKAFDTALDMAEAFRAKLYVVHVLPPVINPMVTEEAWVLPEEPRKTLLLNLEERLQQDYMSRIRPGMDHELVILDGHVSSEIIGFLSDMDIDLVITGSYGESGMGLVLFGSVAKRVARKAACSVMIVREKGSSPGENA
jgi:universal stress protein A